MDKSKFYFNNGTPFFGIFRENPVNFHFSLEQKEPVYTIEEEDNDLPSAHKVYMESMNEYEAAMKLVPSWAFWKQMLRQSVKVRRMLDEWREEKLMKDQAKAKRMLWEQAENGNIQAQRLLFESKKEEAQLRQSERGNRARSEKEKDVLEGALDKITSLKRIK